MLPPTNGDLSVNLGDDFSLSQRSGEKVSSRMPAQITAWCQYRDTQVGQPCLGRPVSASSLSLFSPRTAGLTELTMLVSSKTGSMYASSCLHIKR